MKGIVLMEELTILIAIQIHRSWANTPPKKDAILLVLSTEFRNCQIHCYLRDRVQGGILDIECICEIQVGESSRHWDDLLGITFQDEGQEYVE